MNQRKGVIILRNVIATGAIAASCLVAASPAMGHHENDYPSQKALVRIYPGLVNATKYDKQGFTWKRFEQRAHKRWDNTHPALMKVHEAKAARARLTSLPYYNQFICIASHESGGRWDISTGNGYYGGLQMDISFQQTYGPEFYRQKGTANNWSMEEQIRAAGRAVPSRGFHPWPNTARMCGLL